MCKCIVEIKASYTQVMSQTEQVVEQSVDMDRFLDTINEIKKLLEGVINDTNNLIELVRAHFTEITVPEAVELLTLSEPIQKKMQQLYLNLLRSTYHKGLKTTVEKYRHSMDDFDELCQDMKTFNIELAQDASFQNTLNKVSEMISK